MKTSYLLRDINVDPLVVQVLLNQLCHFPVQKGKDLGHEFDHRDLGLLTLEVFHGFDANEATTDYHDIFWSLILQRGVDAVGVLQGFQGKNKGEINPRNGG